MYFYFQEHFEPRWERQHFLCVQDLDCAPR